MRKSKWFLLGEPADLPLEAIGLGQAVQRVLYLISLLPFVGFVIGGNYAMRRNAATRQLGRRLLRFTLLLHSFYMLCLCPAALLLAAR